MPDSLNLESPFLRLHISLNDGLVSPQRIETTEGLVWADRPQRIQFDFRTRSGGIYKTKTLRYLFHSTKKTADATFWIVQTQCVFDNDATTEVLVQLRYTLLNDQPIFTEAIQIEARGDEPLFLHNALLVWVLEDRTDVGWLPIPFGEGHTSTAPTLLTDAATGGGLNRDGAILFDKSGNHLVIAKTPSDRDPEFVVVHSWKHTIAYSGFRAEQAFNDCSRWLVDNQYASSPTRFELVRGRLEDAFISHRSYMELCGIGLPKNYHPPLNYCIYYECGGEWHREQMARLLPVAADLGCTLLYTDQGWETSFGSSVWDDDRLGSCRDFVAEAAKHGLEIGVLVSLHAKKDSWPAEVYRRGLQGTIEDGDQWHGFGICPASSFWQQKKTELLAKLVADGVTFYSFDFNDCKSYSGFDFRTYSCYSAEHGHAVPMSQWEHITAVAEQQRAFRERCSSATVEAHDWALAGDSSLPMYLFPRSSQERWGFEYMWDPLADFKAGRLHNLYYYNLSYSRPLYLHIDLAKDNEDCVAFWYVASTVRHLGIGNFTALSPEGQIRVRAAVAAWHLVRDFLSGGIFRGLNRLVHIHTLPGRGAAVLIFNDTPSPMTHDLEFDLTQLEIFEGKQVEFIPFIGPHGDFAVHQQTLSITVTLPPFSVAGFTVN